MTARYCPAGCGRTLRKADVLCGVCMGKVTHRTQSDLKSAWRRFSHTFSPADMSVYTVIINRAVREARLAMGDARAVIDTEAPR